MNGQTSNHLGRVGLVGVMLLAGLQSVVAQAPRSKIELSPSVVKLLEEPTLTEAERRRAHLFHGHWEELDDPSVSEAAEIALYRFDLLNPALDEPTVSPLVRARAALLRGQPRKAIDLLNDTPSTRALTVRAEAFWQLGQIARSVDELRPWRDRLATETISEAAALTAAADALVMLARLEGRPGDDYHLAIRLYGRAHQEIDRLYWPAKLAEAALLFEKDNSREAVEGLLEALALNPRTGDAWYMLGQIGLEGYNFEQAGWAIEQLRQINPQHLLANLLEARMLIQQKDAAGAQQSMRTARERYPQHRELVALWAAAKALAFDDEALSEALRRFDEFSPGNPLAHFTVGKYLSMARQYESGETHLRAAIERFPNWPTPRVELGLLLMQSGSEEEARKQLSQAARLDPFNRRCRNQLELVEELLGYERIETPHFVIKYRNGIDEALARDMPDPLERIYDDVTAVFRHRPARRTLIEIMPDDQWLGVRITGMPEIWTIGASTGDVIAIIPPRDGPNQRGPYDWETVVRHEFVHTVTLDQTSNRIPHWFTEACAVSQENRGRDYDTCQMLATALHEDALFDLEQINWAFIRPKTPNARPLAYAQAHWMLEHIIETYGHDLIVKMLELYQHGATNRNAIKQVTGREADMFLDDFRSWAHGQVTSWGLTPTADDSRIADLLAKSEGAVDQQLDALLAEFPRHPDLLRLDAQRSLNEPGYDEARTAVLRYAESRPADPWSHRALVHLANRHDRIEDAIGPLEQLDRMELHSAEWPRELARIHRSRGRLDQAAAAMKRALYREPYNATLREIAAAIALQHDDTDSAVHHIHALTVLEPQRSIQWVRLAATYDRSGRPERAKEAARKARELDPEAPVSRFLRGE